jgi:YD repeat-containing protein
VRIITIQARLFKQRGAIIPYLISSSGKVSEVRDRNTGNLRMKLVYDAEGQRLAKYSYDALGVQRRLLIAESTPPTV